MRWSAAVRSVALTSLAYPSWDLNVWAVTFLELKSNKCLYIKVINIKPESRTFLGTCFEDGFLRILSMNDVTNVFIPIKVRMLSRKYTYSVIANPIFATSDTRHCNVRSGQLRQGWCSGGVSRGSPGLMTAASESESQPKQTSCHLNCHWFTVWTLDFNFIFTVTVTQCNNNKR